jgi:hypothetical protein
MTLIVNFFGAPGSGKSTSAAGVFYKLKIAGIESELVTEYAKDIVWEESLKTLHNQIFVFANQHHRIYRCLGKVDVIITDSPINLGIIYGKMYNGHISPHLEELIKTEFLAQKSYNVFLKRNHKYNTKGRYQTEDEANIIDVKIAEMLIDHNIEYTEFEPGQSTTDFVVTEILKRI